MGRSRILVVCILAALVAGPAAGGTDGPRFRALVFTKTAGGFRHTSIDDAVAAFDVLAAEHRFQVLHTEDASHFTDDGLKCFDVVAFVLTTGDVLDADQEAASSDTSTTGAGSSGCIPPATPSTAGPGTETW